MQFDLLIRLAHHRWNIAVLAELFRTSGAKFVTLANRLQLSRSSLKSSLDDLMRQGLVTRNKGYGHPMRPEYLLTVAGRALGKNCVALTARIGRNDPLIFKKWSLPLIAAIGFETLRFSELRTTLDGITPRALTLGLKELEKHRWVKRSVTQDYPPCTGYALQPPATRIWKILHALCVPAT